MDINELKANVDKLSKQVQQETKDLPVLSTLFSALMVIFTSLFEQIDNQTKVIENLTDKLANKTLNSKRAKDENINGHRSERNKGVDSSDKGRKDDLPKTKKTRPGKEIKVEHRESYIGYKGKELTSEEAEALIGTVFEGDDGKKYRYTRKLASSVKDELQVNLIETQYYKLEYVEIDEQGQEVDGTRETAVSAKTDFLKKTFVSVNLMAWVFYLWMSLKSPVNRISSALSEYGLKLSKQQLYKDIDIVAVMLRPLFKHLESYLKEEKQLCVDETYHSCGEKRRRKEESSLDKQSTGRKEQRAASKTLRSYFYGIVGEKICLYYHDLVRSSDIPKDILKGLGIKSDTFVETDGFYRKSFNQDQNKQLFEHGVCWVHAKRYFCVLLNYATTKDGETVKEFVKANWEQDIVDARRLTDKISMAFRRCNDITVRCQEDSSLDLVTLKNRELRPLIEDICQDARDVYAKIKGSDDGLKPIRNCSENAGCDWLSGSP